MNRDLIRQIILNNQERDYSFVVPRRQAIDPDLNKVQCLIGVRRCGKTHLMFSMMHRLMESGLRENVVYVNFEDDRLFPLQLQDLSDIPEVYYELFPGKRNERVYFFFDEIQEITHWEKFVRRLYDTENCRICISGSSAKLLRQEMLSALRGRSLATEVFPLSFDEFLLFRKIDFRKLTSRTQSHIKHAFAEYLTKGGFPELAAHDADTARRITREYMDMIIYRDLIERHNISNRFLMKHLVKFCFTNVSEMLSINKLYNDFRSQGLVFSKKTLYQYVDYLEDAYAIFPVPLFAKSVREQLRNPRKLYAVDVSFKKAVSMEEDLGKLFENIAYLHLRRKFPDIYYYKRNQEVDFWLPESRQLVNTSYDISHPNTFGREIKGLTDAMKHLKLKESWLINSTREERLKTAGCTIHIRPMWKWLLGLYV